MPAKHKLRRFYLYQINRLAVKENLWTDYGLWKGHALSIRLYKNLELVYLCSHADYPQATGHEQQILTICAGDGKIVVQNARVLAHFYEFL